MIAMQYGIGLPADYDMGIIRRRTADKGHLLDDFDGLVFKAYLHASRGDARLPSRDGLAFALDGLDVAFDVDVRDSARRMKEGRA